MSITYHNIQRPVAIRSPRRLPKTRSFLVDLTHPETGGFSPGHEYVRRFWAAAIGRGAIRDLLELFLAGLRQRKIDEPFHLGVLLSAGLVEMSENRIRMPARVPLLHSSLVARLHPALRLDHRRFES